MSKGVSSFPNLIKDTANTRVHHWRSLRRPRCFEQSQTICDISNNTGGINLIQQQVPNPICINYNRRKCEQ